VIPVKRPDLDDAEWLVWHADAIAALKEIRDEYKPGLSVEVKDKLYKRAMPFLLKLFNEKCAYCESVISNTQPGDVEHYRPKGRLKDLDGKIVKVKIGNQEVEHPGYWWLCYEWKNLLPSCIDCNRRRNHGDDEIAAGKADLFPIAGKRAINPDDPLGDEQALLLNPTDDDFDPSVHFDFQSDGKIKPKTTQAQTTSDLLGLNVREKLVEMRAEKYSEGIYHITAFLGSMIAILDTPGQMSDREKALRLKINAMWEGRTQYSAFAKLALATASKALAQRNIPLTFPLSIS